MKIKLNRPDTTAKPKLEPGRHIARVVQVSNVGLQRPFRRTNHPNHGWVWPSSLRAARLWAGLSQSRNP